MTEYDKLKALNRSSLKHMAISPLEYRWRIHHPEPRKTHYLLGNAIHCLVLEPDEFDDRYALCGITRNKRHGAYQEWMEENIGKEALSQKEMDTARTAADAVFAHRVAVDKLDGCRHEEPLIWDDPDTGLKCKGRVDTINTECVGDLKTGRNPTPRKFARDAADFMYHGQLSLYHTGATVLRKIDGKQPPFIIAVSTDMDHAIDVVVYQMKPDDLNAGRALCVQLMRRLEDCIASDMWPGCAPDLQYLDLPPWAPGLQSETEESW